MTQLWSWLLTAVGVTGLYLAGRKSKAGWAVGFGAQALWIAYAVATRQWGFIASALAYASVYARNWLRWRREAGAARSPVTCQENVETLFLGAREQHLHECVRERGHRSAIHRCGCGVEWSLAPSSTSSEERP